MKSRLVIRAGVALAGAAIIGFALVRLVKAGLDQGKNDKS